MWTIYLHQIHDNLRSLRFQVSLGVLLLFFVCNGLVYIMKTDRLLHEDQVIAADNTRRYEEAETVSAATDSWYSLLNPATGTEFIAEAGFDWFPSSIWLSPNSGSIMNLGNVRSTNNWMRRFDVLDWVLIVRYMLSFLCVVLAYNAISGELERGTLRLVLANPLARGSFLAGKFLAHLTTLVVVVLLGSLLSLAMLAMSGLVTLDGALWRSYAFFLLTATLFAALFLLLSIGVSVLARNSASSLVFLVTAWTLLIVVIPQASYLIATQRVDSIGTTAWDDINRVQEEAETALQREGSMPRDPVLAAQDGYAAEKRYIRRVQKVDKEINQMRRQMEKQRQDQFKTAMTVNLLSPGYAFQYSIEALLGAGVQHVEHFSDQGWRYRQHLQTFLRGRDEADPDSPHIHFLPAFMSKEELDPRLMPRFQGTPIPFETRVANGMTPIVVLILETMGAFFFALWAFNRADLAGGE
ncbi:MAG: ABC transporter permease subunit [Candidatus Latescibacteria bacterium]|nr:ABC transporter permease subunit [Candidatus Latescibacterota bacterium]